MKYQPEKIVISLFLILVFLPACATDSGNSFFNDSGENRETPGLSKRDRKEIEAGEGIHREILTSFSVFSETKANEYVEEITRTIGASSNRPKLPYHCTILYSDKIYATSAPGGHVYITTGFINILDNESELAGVIAHEVAQVQYQNPKYSAGKQALKTAETAVGLAGGFFGPYGMLAFAGIAALNYMTDEKGMDKRAEIADRKAMVYMLKAGYDPQCTMDVLYKILYAEPPQVPYLVDYYQSRPINADRIQKLNKCFLSLELADKTFDTHRDKFLVAMVGVKELYMEKP